MKKTLLLLINILFFVNINSKAQDSTSAQRHELISEYKKLYSDTLKNQADSIIDYALEHVGIKYKYAGNSPQTGFDCSGFVNYVFGKFNYSLPRSSRYFDDVGQNIEKENCKKGDIILFQGYDVKKNQTGHVGIVISNSNGKITFIHSASSKNRGIVVSDFDTEYYKKRYRSVKRVIKNK